MTKDSGSSRGSITAREAYTRAAGNAGAFEELARILDERITPVYRQFASELGIAGEAELGLPRTLDGEGGLTRGVGSS